MLWDFQAKVGPVNSKQKYGILVSPIRVLAGWGWGRRRPREAEETVDHKGCWGSHLRNLYLPAALQTAVKGVSFQGEEGLVSI